MKGIAINGLGRIGPMVLRYCVATRSKEIELVVANDLVPTDDLAYLIKYDSVHRQLPFPVTAEKDAVHVGDVTVKITAEKDPAQLPWKKPGIDAVIESTGHFTKREVAAKHLEAGARRLIISAPAPDADITVAVGVNEDKFDPKYHRVISIASYTTNSLVPPLNVLMDSFGVERSIIRTPAPDTVKGYTSWKENRSTMRWIGCLLSQKLWSGVNGYPSVFSTAKTGLFTKNSSRLLSKCL